ncbi:hypothetical protein E2C01_101575 [Portunus trituberculatus]|uniref:Uncharacterized protein n=1 Tax=Portunus trituberculatus TaxID=210409 RepID=A0A5B7KGD6_PORTR|nr:hypothetical protein [Portunus trituberculatus]
MVRELSVSEYRPRSHHQPFVTASPFLINAPTKPPKHWCTSTSPSFHPPVHITSPQRTSPLHPASSETYCPFAPIN